MSAEARDINQSSHISKGLSRAKALTERTHKLLVNIATCIKVQAFSELFTLQNLVTTATSQLQLLAHLEVHQLTRLKEEILNTQTEIPLEPIQEWVDKLESLNSILRRALLHITLAKRLKEPPAVTTPNIPDLLPAEISELKKLNSQLLFAQIALGEEHVEAVGTRLNLDPTSACNVKCVTCYQNYSENFEPYVIPVVALEKTFEALVFFEGLDIFGGGEPTLSRHLSVIVDQVERAKVHANLLTNGTLLGRRTLPLDKLQSLTISWDGARPETLEKIRLGVQYEDTLQRVREIRKEFPKLRLAFNVTINRANVDEIEEIVQLAVSLGMQHVNFTRMYGPQHLEPLCLTLSDIDELERQLAGARNVGQAGGVSVSSAIHYDGFKAEAPPVQKQAILHEFALKPAVKRRTGDTIESLCEELLRLGSVNFPFSLPVWVPQVPGLVTSPYQLEYDVSALRDKVNKRLEKLRETPAENVIVPFCMSPWVHNFVSASGALRPCCLIVDDYGDLTKPGSMLQQLNSPKLKALRSGLLGKGQHPAPCKGCTFIERYHSTPEYLSFLESIGKNTEDLRFPMDFNPGSNVKIRSRKLLDVSEITWRSLSTETPVVPTSNQTFFDLLKAGLLKSSDFSYADQSGHWYRTSWMAEPSKSITIATAAHRPDADGEEEKARTLAQNLWKRFTEVQPCTIVSASVEVESSGELSAEVTMTNHPEQWLWGIGGS